MTLLQQLAAAGMLCLAAALTPTTRLRAQELAAPRDGATPELMLAISEFNATWRAAWLRSAQLRLDADDAQQRLRRRVYAHCDWHSFKERQGAAALAEGPVNAPEPYYEMFQTARGRFGFCPTWLLTPTVSAAQDESRWRDGALHPSLRDDVANVRAALTQTVRQHLERGGSDAWARGQLVRLELDARNLPGARTASVECATPAWWCSGLRALVLERSGEILAADSGFARMRAAMPPAVRCVWEDMTDLLPTEARDTYAGLGCTGRDSLHARIWWLADPLYRMAGNARYVEHNVRRMEVALRQSTTQDERYAFDAARGGDALAHVLTRYGWPTYTGWAGFLVDRAHTKYLMARYTGSPPSPPAPPYTTFEYGRAAVATIPSWRAITTPFAATSEQWLLHPEDRAGVPREDWWPREHYRPPHRLVGLPQGQEVFVRRQDVVEIAASVALTHPALRASAQPPQRFDVMLLATRGPTHVDSVAQALTLGGSAVVLRGIVPPGPMLLAIEALGTGDNLVDARTRFGIRAPAPLSAFAPREIALSDVALLAPLPDSALRHPSGDLLAHLLPERRLSGRARTVVLYWESYGVRPTDSAVMAVRIVSAADAGLLRRVGMLVGVASDPSTSIGFEWRDHEPRGSVTTLQGPIPVQMRTLQLDLRSLKPGRYVLEIAIRAQDGRTANQQTIIELVE